MVARTKGEIGVYADWDVVIFIRQLIRIMNAI